MQTRRIHGIQGVQLPYVEYITTLFTLPCLGAEEETLICIIYVFVRAGILPGEPDMVESFLSYTRSQRRAKHLAAAVAALEIASNCLIITGNYLRVYREAWAPLCESYDPMLDASLPLGTVFFWLMSGRICLFQESPTFKNYHLKTESFSLARPTHNLTLS